VRLKLHEWTRADYIMQCNNPDIFNHYACLSASLIQDSVVTANLVANLNTFKQAPFIEDVLAALYSRNNPVSHIRDYVLQEQNPKNDLAIQTALCALSSKVPPAAFQKSVKSLVSTSKEKWKTDLFKNILANKVPFIYSLTNKTQIVTKNWNNVTVSLYTDGALISNGTILEFDPN
jgi:hypothetical protein